MLSISVIIPAIPSRQKFFNENCMPMIEANEPFEILMAVDNGPKAKKVNDLVAQAKGEFVFLCDDDIILHEVCLHTLWFDIGEADVCYGNFLEINHPWYGNHFCCWHKFDPNVLRHHNFISNMSLIRRSKWVGMDESLPVYLDWDMWLRMLNNGSSFVYSNHLLFTAFYNDVGITKKTDQRVWAPKIREKYA